MAATASVLKQTLKADTERGKEMIVLTKRKKFVLHKRLGELVLLLLQQPLPILEEEGSDSRDDNYTLLRLVYPVGS